MLLALGLMYSISWEKVRYIDPVLYEPGKHTDDISNASLAAIPRPLSIVPTDLIRATDTNIFRLVSKAYRGRWRKAPSVLYQQFLNEKMICEQGDIPSEH
jgi:hypothetical protein